MNFEAHILQNRRLSSVSISKLHLTLLRRKQRITRSKDKVFIQFFHSTFWFVNGCILNILICDFNKISFLANYPSYSRSYSKFLITKPKSVSRPCISSQVRPHHTFFWPLQRALSTSLRLFVPHSEPWSLTLRVFSSNSTSDPRHTFYTCTLPFIHRISRLQDAPSSNCKARHFDRVRLKQRFTARIVLKPTWFGEK